MTEVQERQGQMNWLNSTNWTMAHRMSSNNWQDFVKYSVAVSNKIKIFPNRNDLPRKATTPPMLLSRLGPISQKQQADSPAFYLVFVDRNLIFERITKNENTFLIVVCWFYRQFWSFSVVFVKQFRLENIPLINNVRQNRILFNAAARTINM